MPQDRLHYLITQSGNRTIAHCLDYDLVAAADTPHEAVRRLTFVVTAHVGTANKQGLCLALEHRAPESYWRKYEQFYT